MSTKFRLSDLVPAGFIAERITHIDDETCILLSRADATASCQHADECRERFEAAITARSRTSQYREDASGFSCARGGSPVMRCSAASRYSPSGSAMCYLPTPDEPGVSSISSTIWASRLRTPGGTFCTAAHASRQQRHLAPRHPQARIAAVDPALGDWYRRLGLASKSSLWHDRV